MYVIPGTTKSIVLVHFESFRINLTTQPAFLVALTRAVDTSHIYTDNKLDLLRHIQKNIGVKRSSLEVINEFPLHHNANGSTPEVMHKEVYPETYKHLNMKSIKIIGQQEKETEIER